MPKTTFKSWFVQKRRHVSTAEHYKFSDKFQLAFFYFSQIAFLIFAILLLAIQYQWIIVLSLIGFRYLFAWISMGYAAAKLKEKDVIYWFPIIELILIIVQLNVYISNKFSKPVHWK
jgi:hypothetical protein